MWPLPRWRWSPAWRSAAGKARPRVTRLPPRTRRASSPRSRVRRSSGRWVTEPRTRRRRQSRSADCRFRSGSPALPGRRLRPGDARGVRNELRADLWCCERGDRADAGNHDAGLADQGYDPYWQEVWGASTPPYYTFRVSGWQVLSLNSEIDHEPGSPQLEWLDAASRPAGTAGSPFGIGPGSAPAWTTATRQTSQPLWDAVRGRARIVLNGHEHDMQRLTPPRRHHGVRLRRRGSVALRHRRVRPQAAFLQRLAVRRPAPGTAPWGGAPFVRHRGRRGAGPREHLL